MWTKRFGDRSRAIALTLMLGGIVERLMWNLLRPDFGAEGEAKNVALAVADGRGFADAYHLGQGPTAHLLPVSPGIGGAVYFLFGARSETAEFILSAWAIGLAIGTYALLYRAFRYLGVPRKFRLAGLAIGCLAPTYISQEAVDFRVWEGGLATFLTALFLERLLALRNGPGDAHRGRRHAQPLLLGLCATLLFFVNPLLGLAALVSLAFFTLRHLSPGQIAAALAGVVAVSLLTIMPWALRNARTLDSPVLLRSNAGLELALTNYPAAAHTRDERGEFLRRLNEIHPTMNAEAFRQMQRIGEVRYFNAMGQVAVDWISAYPADAARLWLHHIREMILPSAWKFDVDGTSRSAWLKTFLARAVGLFGMIGLATLLWRRPGRGTIYPAAIVICTTLAVSPFQPVVRYTYLIYPIMTFFASATPLLFERRARASD